MKTIKTFFLFAIVLIIAIPIVSFNYKKNQASLIDNRMLTELSDYRTDTIDNYLDDRIGLREAMVNVYNRFCSDVFNVMTHPEYMMGKYKHFYPDIDTEYTYADYHDHFLDAVAEIQEYCTDRGIDFYFVFDPSKSSIETDNLPIGINVSADWIDEFLYQAKERRINLIDNYEYLLKLKDSENTKLFNQQYDVHHWNDYGAFKGINNILLSVKADINDEDSFRIESVTKDTLVDSNYKIHESVPSYFPKFDIIDQSDMYREGLEFKDGFNEFEYFLSNSKNDIRLLSFEGSYLISGDRTRRFIANNFGTTVAVHNYQNIYNAPYYINVFKPDLVIFEVADYVLKEYYFSEYYMSTMKLQPRLILDELSIEHCGDEMYGYADSGCYRKVFVRKSIDYDYAYLLCDGAVADFMSYDNDYACITLQRDEIVNSETLQIVYVQKQNGMAFCYELIEGDVFNG